MDCDTIIVGSGFGGLISAAILAKHGLKVTVIEKHDKPGGFATQFKRKGYEFEVAVHSIEGYNSKNIRSRIFDFLEIDKMVRFLPMKNLYRLHGHKGHLDIPCHIDGAKEALKTKYPCQSAGIDQFFKKMIQVSEEFYNFQTDESEMNFENPMFPILFPNLCDLLQTSLSNFVSQIVNNDELRWLLISNIGFYHNDPSRYPSAFFLVNQHHYFKGGAVYTRGGTQNLSNALVDIIVKNGGQVLLKHEVKTINTIDNNTIEVHVKPTSSQKEDFILSAKYCVINAPIPYAEEKLLEIDNPKRPQKISTSATTLYLGLSEAFHNLYPVDFFNFFTEKGLGSGASTNNLDFSLVDSSFVDQTPFEKGKFTADIVFLDDYNRWQKAFSEDHYEELKHQTIESIIHRLKKLVPKLDQYIDVFELGTPKTIEHFTNNTSGAAYGYDIASVPIQNALASLSIHHQPWLEGSKNILFASAWSSLSHGLTGASLSGFQSARTLLEIEGIDIQLN